MMTFHKWLRLRESASGLGQVAGVGVDDENFHVKFSIRDLIAKAQRYPVRDIPIATLMPFLQGRQEDQSQTQARANAADLQYPIIVVANDQGRIFQILDGTHRVQKAAGMGMQSIKGHVIPKQDMGEFAVRQQQPQQPNMMQPQQAMR